MAVLSFLFGLKLYERKRQQELNWQRDIGFYAMTRKVKNFFRKNGWHVRRNVEFQKNEPTMEYDFVTSRNSMELIVKCYPSGMTSFTAAIRDFSRLKIFSHLKRFGLVFLTAEKAPREVILTALTEGIFVIHYKSLNKLNALDVISFVALEDLVKRES